jgi:hypothetical protein
MNEEQMCELLVEEEVSAFRIRYDDASKRASQISSESMAFASLVRRAFDQGKKTDWWYLQWRGLPTPLQLAGLEAEQQQCQQEAKKEASRSNECAEKKCDSVDTLADSEQINYASTGLVAFMQSMGVPPFLAQHTIKQRNVWMGRIRTSNCHFDGQDNVICVVKGYKLVHLYSPWELHRLYPRSNKLLPIESSFGSVSNGLTAQERYPLLKDVHRWQGKVEAGECLYIPNGWWHEVFTPAPALAVNMWFTPVDRSRFRPTIMYLRSEKYLRFFSAAQQRDSPV